MTISDQSGASHVIRNAVDDRSSTIVNELSSALKRLDQLLHGATQAIQNSLGGETAADPFRGLHISPWVAERLLNQEPLEPQLWSGDDLETDWILGDTRWGWLRRHYQLTAFDLDVILVALAPELDTRYERLYSYLQDDVTKKRPTVGFILDLLCSDAESKLIARQFFASQSTLLKRDLAMLLDDKSQQEPPLLSRYVKLDEQIVDFIIGHGTLDRRLTPFCERIEPDRDPVNDIERATPREETFRVCFHGPDAIGRRSQAAEIAHRARQPILVVNLERIPRTDSLSVVSAVRLALRESMFRDAIVWVEGWESIASDPVSRQHIAELLNKSERSLIVSTPDPHVLSDTPLSGFHQVDFPIPCAAVRRQVWLQALSAEGVLGRSDDLDAVAERFRLTRAQIQSAVSSVCNALRWDRLWDPSNETASVAEQDLLLSARLQSGLNLQTLTQKIVPKHTWDDVVLSSTALQQLQEICQRIRLQQRVLDEWGFADRLSYGTGTTALFAGPSGTGKTICAEIIARELGMDLYKIDLSGVVSKYIGETEKNLAKVFQAAETANAVLFFDEADSLFGKRSEVRDSHDRYANIEVSYLLQRMEAYEGLAILATNLRASLDESFSRRLSFTVSFSLPEADHRRQIWQKIWPPRVRFSSDVDLDYLATEFELSGGNIKNIALAASFLAAAEGDEVTMEHLFLATKREYQKMGKLLSDSELRRNLILRGSHDLHDP